MSTKKKEFFDWKSGDDFCLIYIKEIDEGLTDLKDVKHFKMNKWGYMTNSNGVTYLEAEVILYLDLDRTKRVTAVFHADIMETAAKRLMKVENLNLYNEEAALKFIKEHDLGSLIINRALYGYFREIISRRFLERIYNT